MRARLASALGRTRAALAVTALGAGCAALVGTESSHASDANRAHAFVVGRSAGLATSEWLDSSNSSRARSSFPRTPAIAFRVRLSGGIGQAPASDAAGNLIIAHGEPRVSKLDARGHTLWTKRLESEATAAPVLLSDGSILVLTHDAEALLFASTGNLQHRTPLPLGEVRHRTLAIPTANGGALVATGTDVLELDTTGEVVRQTHTPANVTALAQWRAGLLAICDNGAVARAQETGDFEAIGNLGGATPEGAAVQGDELFAVVDAHKLVAFDLIRRNIVVLASDAAVTLAGPPVLFENGGTGIVADGGFLSLHGRAGSETLRVSLTETSRAFDPATRALRPAQAISDEHGAVAAVRSATDALVLAPDGKTQRVEGTSCLDPFRPTPTRTGLLLACRAGQLFGVSDKAP